MPKQCEQLQLPLVVSPSEKVISSAFNGKSFHHPDAKVRTKMCDTCGKQFKPRGGGQRFCSLACRGKWKYIAGDVTTASQYERISGNFNRYLPRLLYFGGKKRSRLTREILLKKLEEQGGKCALTGVELTCLLKKGKRFATNVSVDRIEAGGPYSEENIQLVCQAVNQWRSDLSVEEFQAWCKKVVEHERNKNAEEEGLQEGGSGI